MAGMYPKNEEITIFGEKVQWPGVDASGKFTNGSFDDPLVKPSFIPAETINLILDNLSGLITKLGGTPNNTSAAQLAELFVSAATANKGIMRDAAGRAQVAAPATEADIARKKEIDDIINGIVALKKLTVEGDIIQKGPNKITHAEDVYTKKDMIHLREGAIAALASNALAGLIAERYDGTKNGVLAFDKTGTARVGDEGDAQPLATRAESSEMSDGAFVRWNGGKQRLETQGGTHITVTDSYDTGTIEYDKTIVVKAASPVILTLGNGTYAGIEVKIINSTQKDHAIRGTTARDGDSTLQAGQIQTIIWNGNKWEGLSCPRIGEVYVQYPQQTTPMDLFVCTKWKLQEQYAGAFFRATGGNAAAFIEKTGNLIAQSGQNKNHKHNGTTHNMSGNNEGSVTGYGVNEAGFFRSRSGNITLSNEAGINLDSANWGSGTYRTFNISVQHTHKFTTDPNGGDEARPDNYTFRIWLRTA